MNDVKIYLIGDGLVNSDHIIFGDDLTLSREMEGGQRFFRTKITGKIKFTSENFEQIYYSDPNFRWQVQYYMVERGVETLLANGYFYKYDCSFDVDNKVCEVEPIVQDNYTKLLAGLDKVYNIVELAPNVSQVEITKNYAFQFYTPDDNKLTIAIGGAYFEVSCSEKNRGELPSLHFDQIFARYCFSLSKANFSDGFVERHPNVFGIYNGTQYILGEYTLDGTNYIIRVEDDDGWANVFLIDMGDSPETIIATGRAMWTDPGGVEAFSWQEEYYGNVSDSIISNEWVEMWGRVICPKGDSYYVFDIPTDDITERNLNYAKCMGINDFLQRAGAPSIAFNKYFVFSSETSATPTKWGKTLNDDYFVKPYREYYPLIPLGQTFWGVISMWFWFPPFSGMDSYTEAVKIKDTYPLYSVISRLLEKIDNSISFSNSVEYSRFLFEDRNPITKGWNGEYLLAPITNIKSSYYSSPAQRGDISLATIFDFLKKMFQCYWFIDDNKRLRIEHVSWFKEGGYYSIDETPSFGILSDLTERICPITQKPWSFGINKIEYDKKSAPNRYEFGFADKSTEPFNGYAIDIKDESVADCSKEDCTISSINTDVDMILSSPSAFNDDTLAFLNSRYGVVRTANVSYRGNPTAPAYRIQNGFLSFFYLEQYFYSQDLGGMSAVIDTIGALSPMFPRGRALKRIMSQSGVITPMSLADSLGNGSIKTDIGIGEFHKLEWNLQSKIATLELFFAPK